MLKKAFTILLIQLTHLFNCLQGSSIFPDELKLGKIIPIPKSKVMKYVTNWRPISLLSLPGKLLEKLVHKQLVWYLRYNNLLSEQQHGFISAKVLQLQSKILCIMSLIKSIDIICAVEYMLICLKRLTR